MHIWILKLANCITWAPDSSHYFLSQRENISANVEFTCEPNFWIFDFYATLLYFVILSKSLIQNFMHVKLFPRFPPKFITFYFLILFTDFVVWIPFSCTHIFCTLRYLYKVNFLYLFLHVYNFTFERII